MFLGPDTIMGAGAAEEPAGPGVRGSCVNKSLLHRLKRETQAPWKSGKLRASIPGCPDWGWQEERQKRASRVDERLAGGREMEPSKHGKQYERSQDTLWRAGR